MAASVALSNSQKLKDQRSRYRKRCIKRHWQLYILFALPLFSVILFSYVPMYGIIIAFKNYVAADGIWGSAWVGLHHFRVFFSSHQFTRLIQNTIGISLYALIAGFPIPILFAILINECQFLKFKKTVQMVSYAPHFISTVVMVAMVIMFLNPRSGLLGRGIAFFTGEMVDYMASPSHFWHIFVWSGIWQGMGFSAVIYIAALAGVDPSLHEAAKVDGASKLQKIWHVDLPGITPTIVILLILSFGSVMSVGAERALLMQNPLNMSRSDVITTFVFRMGLEHAQFSFAAAVGLFNSVVNAGMLVLVNQIARRLGETSLW